MINDAKDNTITNIEGNKKILQDFTDYTCTNLMIKLKILTKRMKTGDCLEFFTTREGNSNLIKPFSKKPFNYNVIEKEPNKFLVTIMKNR